METFQRRKIKFDEITEDMDIPSGRRELTPFNIDWMIKNLPIKNSRHFFFKKAMEMLQEFAQEVKK